MTVATPALKNDPFAEASPSLGYEGARLILGRRSDCYNGNSHQMFDIDADTGVITAFATDMLDAGKYTDKSFGHPSQFCQLCIFCLP